MVNTIRKTSIWAHLPLMGSLSMDVSVVRSVDIDDEARTFNRRAEHLLLSGIVPGGETCSWRLNPDQARKLAQHLYRAADDFDATPEATS